MPISIKRLFYILTEKFVDSGEKSAQILSCLFIKTMIYLNYDRREGGKREIRIFKLAETG